MLAEDNRTNQKVIARILEKIGHTVVIAENGEVALDKLAADSFHLVLMDVNMPVMNGIDASKLYQFTNINGPLVPILALTADVTQESQLRCKEAGMAACLTKPIEMIKLITAINNFALADDIALAATTKIPPGKLSNPTGILDTNVLNQLETLGGTDFVDEIVDQFSDDASAVLKGLMVAVAERDAATFRDSAHALRSCAANVGAQAIYSTCMQWRDIGTDDLDKNGQSLLAKLQQELSEARAALTHYREQRPGQSPTSARPETAIARAG